MEQKHYVWVAAAVGILIGIFVWLFVVPKNAVAPTSGTSTTTAQTAGSSTPVVSEGNQNTPQPPALKPIIFAAGTAADVQTALEAQYSVLKPQLAAAPTRVDLWLQLGILYKIGGDYQDAAVAWTYVAEAAPLSVSYVAYGNLGDLYLNFTHDYAKAVASYKAALAIKPGIADYQTGLKQAQQLLGQ